MKANKRKLFVELTELSGAGLCLACKYAYYVGGGSSVCDGGEGYYECHHPIDNLSFMNTWEEELEPGTDCYGFYPRIDIDTLTEFASTIITNGINQWTVDLNKNYFELDTVKYSHNEEKELVTEFTRYTFNNKAQQK